MIRSIQFLNICLVAALGLVSVQSYAETDAELMASGQWRDPATGLIWDRCLVGQNWDGKTCVGTYAGYTWSDAKEKTQLHRLGGHTDWQLPTIAQLRTLLRCSKGYAGSSKISAAPFIGEFEVFGSCQAESKRPTVDTSIFPNSSSSLHWTSSIANESTPLIKPNQASNNTRKSNTVNMMAMSFAYGYSGGVKVTVNTSSLLQNLDLPQKKLYTSVILSSDSGDIVTNLLPVVRLVRTDKSLERDSFIGFFEREKKQASSGWKPDSIQSAQLEAAPIEKNERSKVGNDKLMPQGIWLDPKTNFMWMRCSVGQKWKASTCEGVPIKLDWQDAQEYVKRFVNSAEGFAGYTDWRIPTIEELVTIRVCTNGWWMHKESRLTVAGRLDVPTKEVTIALNSGVSVPYYCDNSASPTLNTKVFLNHASGTYWSNSDYQSPEKGMWGLGFKLGGPGQLLKDDPNSLILVR